MKKSTFAMLALLLFHSPILRSNGAAIRLQTL